MNYIHIDVFQDDDTKEHHKIIELQETVEFLKADKVHTYVHVYLSPLM